MALELKLAYNHSRNGKQLVFQDESNWEEADVDLLDIVSATITIIKDGESSVIDLIDEFETGHSDSLFWEVNTQDLDPQNINQVFPDGVYTIIYSVTEDGEDPISVTGNVLLYFNVKMYVYKYFMNLKDNWKVDLCNDGMITWANNLWAALTSLEHSGYLGNISRVKKNLEFVQKLCKSTSLYELKNK